MLTVEALSAERFRAYTAALAKVGKGKTPHAIEEVAVEGEVEDGKIAFHSEAEITKIVLYRGPVEEEVVVGSIDLNADGDISIEIVAPAEG